MIIFIDGRVHPGQNTILVCFCFFGSVFLVQRLLRVKVDVMYAYYFYFKDVFILDKIRSCFLFVLILFVMFETGCGVLICCVFQVVSILGNKRSFYFYF